ncbi:MAG: ribonuclease HII, partial [Bacteroidota bacterium]
VILPKGFSDPLLNDSKKMTEKQRNLLRLRIEKEAVAWSVMAISAAEIDEINILNASILGMQKAVAGLSQKPEMLLIDGNRFHAMEGIPHRCIIGGDALYMHIAAASVLAKTHRDEFMLKIHDEFPMYEWKKNKGYPTKVHRKGIMLHGPCPYHRMSYKLVEDQLSFNF